MLAKLMSSMSARAKIAEVEIKFQAESVLANEAKSTLLTRLKSKKINRGFDFFQLGSKNLRIFITYQR